MDVSKKPWPVTTVCGIKDRVDTNPDFQRPAVWSRPQKQLLVDTILRNYDVPKFYWRKTGSNPDTYDVVDGQQRLRAIWEFQAGDFPLAADCDPVDDHPIAGLRYGQLPDSLRVQFDIYALDVIVLRDTDEDEVREMFLRLQNGTSLKAQEKRNAMPGQMRSFVKALAAHPFFESCKFANSRFTFDHIAAQMTLLELSGGPCNVRDSNLNAMYEQHKVFDESGPKARKIRRTLDYLKTAFPEKTPELERFNTISLYALASHLLESYVVQARQADLAEWFIAFEAHRRQQDALPIDESDSEFIAYHEQISRSTDAAESIRSRHEFLLRKLFEAVPDIELKDGQRLFKPEQRLAIWRRDKGICQVQLKCRGAKCEWEDWEADHRVPWSQGGPTTVANGQVACSPCNAAKGGDT